MASKVVYRVIETALSVSTAFVVRRALGSAWRRTRGSEPPEDPGAPDTVWKDAVIWAAASAAGLTVGQMAARWGAAHTYRILTGDEPPPRKTKKKKKQHH